METLSIRVDGLEQDAQLSTIPYRILDSYGTPVMEGFASTVGGEVQFQLDETATRDLVHVVATLPNGRQVSTPVMLSNGRGEVVLLEGNVPDQSLEWVKAFRPLDHLVNALGAKSLDQPLGDVWMTLWRFQEGNWKAAQPKFANIVKDDDVQQICLNVPNEVQLLQLGGAKLAWRLVMMPPGGDVRVALTRREVPTDEAVDITVARSRPANELLMSYLSRGSFEVAEKLGDLWSIADDALFYKSEDPVSAAAGAYVLYRLNKLENREGWVENLATRFPYIADGCILQAAMLLRRRNPDVALARSLVRRAVQRGLPIFRVGLSILVETMAALHRGARGELGEGPGPAETKQFRASFLAAQAYLGAQVQSGIYLSFYGRSPVQPSWEKEYGRPESRVRAARRGSLPRTAAYGKVRVFLGGTCSDRQYSIDAGSLDPVRPGIPHTVEQDRELLLTTSKRDVVGKVLGSKPLDEVGSSASPRSLHTQNFWREQRLDFAVDLTSDDSL